MDKTTLMEFAKTKYGVDDSMADICVSLLEDCIRGLIEQTKQSHCPVHLSSMAGDAVLVSKDDYDSWKKTV